MNKKIEAGAVILILVVVLFLLFSSLVPEAQTAGDKLNVSNRCLAVGCAYNITSSANTDNDCRNNVSDEAVSCPDALGKGIPLSGLFKSSGIVFLIIMFVLLLTILRIVIPKKGK